MLLKVSLLLSMLIQLGTAIIAVSMIRRTRFNVSWILISFGFVLMTVQRLFEFSSYYWENRLFPTETINSWVGVVVSVLMLISLFYIRRIFNLQDQLDEMRTNSEKRLLSAVILGEEKARQSIAGDLHDGIGPLLSSIKMLVSSGEYDKRSCDVIDEAIVSLREIANHLSPHLLKNYGLTKALDTFARQLLLATDIKFEMSSEIGVKRYGYDVEISVYRIVAELLNNSVKHAESSLVSLKIFEMGDSSVVEYSDNGKGFDVTAFCSKEGLSGMGLENICSRVKSIGGVFEINSSAGSGVFVKIIIPLA
ncbi:MAG: ATP-binding protein [Pseudomonadota bacterium]|nr:ATP-binding protein [Pseudomonadota bacterium]